MNSTENLVWRNCEIFEKQYQIFMNYTKDQHVVMRYIERMFHSMDFHTSLFLEDLRIMIENLKNEFESTGIAGTLRDCFLFYANSYTKSIGEMIKNYETKKRKYESIKKYNTYETVMTSIDALKQVIINEYMNAGANTSMNKANVIQQTLNIFIHSNSPDCKRYQEGRISGLGFYLTNALLKDFFKINFSIFTDFIETIQQSNYYVIASIFSNLDRLKTLKYEFDAKVNIDNLINVINDKYGVEYDVIQLKPPQLDSFTSANLFGAIENQYEDILIKIQADKKIYYDDEFSCMKAIKQRLDLSGKLIINKKLLVEAIYIMELLNKDFKISRSDKITECRDLAREKTKIKSRMKGSSKKKSDSSEISIAIGKITKPFVDSSTDVIAKLNEPVRIFSKFDGKYVVRNTANQTLYIPVANVMITQRDQAFYDEMDYGMTLLASSHLQNLKAGYGKKASRISSFFKRRQSMTSRSETDTMMKTATRVNDITINDDSDYYASNYMTETVISNSQVAQDDNDSNIYDLMDNNEPFTETKEAVEVENNDDDIVIGDDEKLEQSLNLCRNEVYTILTKSVGEQYIKINKEVRLDDPVKFLGVSTEEGMCVVFSPRLNKKLVVPIGYIKKEYKQVESDYLISKSSRKDKPSDNYENDDNPNEQDNTIYE